MVSTVFKNRIRSSCSIEELRKELEILQRILAEEYVKDTLELREKSLLIRTRIYNLEHDKSPIRY